MITLAFYKGQGGDLLHRVSDATIRFATQGQYSHVEFIAGPAGFDQPIECLSASGRDGGVRAKVIDLKQESWDLVDLAIAPEGPEAFIRAQIGARYDWLGLVMSQVLALGRHNPNRWFCSELVAAALGLSSPQRLSPQMLFDVVTWEMRGQNIVS